MLARQPAIWMEWALAFEQAEYKAQEIAAKIEKQRRDVKGNGNREDE